VGASFEKKVIFGKGERKTKTANQRVNLNGRAGKPVLFSSFMTSGSASQRKASAEGKGREHKKRRRRKRERVRREECDPALYSKKTDAAC